MREKTLLAEIKPRLTVLVFADFKFPWNVTPANCEGNQYNKKLCGVFENLIVSIGLAPQSLQFDPREQFESI